MGREKKRGSLWREIQKNCSSFNLYLGSFKYTLLKYLIICGMTTYVFKPNWVFGLAVLTIWSPNFFLMCMEKIENTRGVYLEQLQSIFNMISIYIGSGQSLEKAILTVVQELSASELINNNLKEKLDLMAVQIQFNLFSPEELRQLTDLLQIKELNQLTDLLGLAIESGEDLAGVMQRYTILISEHVEHIRQYQEKLIQKNMEFKLMIAMPLLAIFAIKKFMPTYLACLENSLSGTTILIFCVIIMSISYYVNGFNNLIKLKEVIE